MSIYHAQILSRLTNGAPAGARPPRSTGRKRPLRYRALAPSLVLLESTLVRSRQAYS